MLYNIIHQMLILLLFCCLMLTENQFYKYCIWRLCYVIGINRICLVLSSFACWPNMGNTMAHSRIIFIQTR